MRGGWGGMGWDGVGWVGGWDISGVGSHMRKLIESLSGNYNIYEANSLPEMLDMERVCYRESIIF